jgi:hypothetical protein
MLLLAEELHRGHLLKMTSLNGVHRRPIVHGPLSRNPKTGLTRLPALRGRNRRNPRGRIYLDPLVTGERPRPHPGPRIGTWMHPSLLPP